MNQGNTCYLNSLIQCLYATPEVRRALYGLSEKDLVVETGEETQPPPQTRVEQEQVAEKKAPVGPPALSATDQESLEMLMGMGFEEAQVRVAIRRFPVDPDNMQRVEYILSGAASDAVSSTTVVVVSEPSKSSSAKGASSDEERDVSDLFDVGATTTIPTMTTTAATTTTTTTTLPRLKERRIPKELQLLFARLQLADANAQSTKRLTDCFGANFSAGVQHDVHELNRILFDRIEKQLRGTSIHDLINILYRGTVVNRVVCKSCGHKSERVEDFLDVSLVVRDFPTVEASLSAFVEDELLDGANLYECGGCKNRVEALKGCRFRELPPVLIVSLSRFEYDPQTWQRVKNSRKYPFPRVLEMTPFMEDPQHQVQPPYDLFGVVIHRGDQASHGHYHAYLLDVLNESGKVGLPHEAVLGEPAKKADDENSGGVFEGWFDFNDSNVRPISSATVDLQFGGSGLAECAYMLVYRQRGSPVLMERGASPPELPLHVRKEIDAENAAIQARRIEWENLKNSIELNVYTAEALEMENGVPRRPARPAGSSTRYVEDEGEDGEQGKPRKFVTITIDRRRTLGDLKRAVMDAFSGDALPPADRLLLHRIRFMDMDRVKFMRPLHRPLSQEGKEVIKGDDAKLDDLATVMHGCDVLVWDGEHLCNGEPFEVAYDLITLCVTLFEADGTARPFEVQVREGTTLGALRVQLEAPLQDWWLFRWDYMRLAELEGEGKTMQELYLNDHVKISLERRSVERTTIDKTFAALHLRAVEEKMDVWVTNNCDDHAVTDAVSCNLAMTVWDLKQAIIAKIGSLNERMPTRLRRALAGGGEGELFPDEGATLKRAGVEAHIRVIIEYGEPPDAASITIKFTWGTPTGQRLLEEMRSLCVDKGATLGEVKKKIMHELQLDGAGAQYRLRKSDFWSHQREIFDDEEKTLKQLGFNDCDCVWLEEGGLPPKGTMELQVELQTSNWESASRDEATLAKRSSDLYQFSTLGMLHVGKSSTLAELLDLIRSDDMLGKLVEGRAFRVWHRSKLLRGNTSRTLKKLGVTQSSTITLQTLPEGVQESPLLLGEDGVLLVVRRRLVDSRTFGPPIELVMPAPRRGMQHFVQRGALVGSLCQMAQLPVGSKLEVIRMISQSGRWKSMVSPYEPLEGQEFEMVEMSGGGGGAIVAGADDVAAPAPAPAQGIKALHAQSVQRKKSDEIYVTDGDLLVWKLLDDDPENGDHLLATLNVNFAGEREYSSSGLQSFSQRSSQQQPRTRPKEISLQIDDDSFWGG